MLRFKEYLEEAYTFFPKSEDDIRKTLGDFSHENVEEIITLFNYLKGKDDTPINIDLKKSKNVNITRALKGDFTLGDISSGAGLNNIKIKFGNGSFGNRGANNRGNAFEPQFANNLLRWYSEGDGAVTDDDHLRAIKDLDKTYNLGETDKDKFKVDVVGGENTRRPLSFGSNIVISNTKGQGNDIGQSVTDITVTTNDGPVYLSLKLGTTTTFFNVGVKTKITKKEIDEGLIKNKDGVKLLKLFGIDNKRFCTIFNDDVPTQGGMVRIKPKVSAMKALLKSGIGYGYHVIHKVRGNIKSYKMDETRMGKSASVGDVTIHYGGKTGKGKRIDMEMASSYYKFKLNIRDTQGGDGYPTRMMCDFTTL